ncbi:MAG: multidrug efflux system membrane fusion protein [Cyclobacteriaceae bacterium]|jgi:RND family efflux transporter MFP subunit
MTVNKSIIILGLAIAVFAVSSCGQKEPAEKTKPVAKKIIPVRAVKVKEQLISVPLFSIGKVYSKMESTLSFKTGGIIKNIYVNNGQRVKKNQVLARLDLSEIQNSVNKGQVAMDKAKRDLIRAQNLYKDKVVTLETVQNAQSAFDVASADLKILKFNLEYSVIKAPSNGLILSKMSEEGELTNAGAPIFEFAGTGQNWIIKSGLVDKEVVKIVLRDTAKISFDAYPNQLFNGWISKISNAPDPMNGTYEVEVSLSEIPDSIKKGFIAKLELQPSKKQRYKIIPIEALAEADQNAGIVYLAIKDRPKKVNVIIETILQDQVLVFGDLNANDFVISEGLSEVNEHSIIEVL